ncbi:MULTISPECIES: type I-B CRISPR-associated protein Cas5b [unclassified Lebetimonas]|uniref:type I-B CRISPR-associated protein Cas5b n=1 Tax=unclassified Lebetimonas TaxID=2648158 RepID=UPI0004676884|nr:MULTISPECIES: type I-B CRISPR-associated protein Cas5b [unclassified Lebetimonas]
MSFKMIKEVISFNLNGDYALFKKPFANSQPQSFVIPPKTAILGMIGAIMGWGKNEYIEKLPFEKFLYSVKLLTPKIKKDLIGINLMQGKSAKFTFNENPLRNPPQRGQRSPTRFEFLKDMEWKIFLIIDDDKIKKELIDRLKNNRFVYNPYLGLQSLFAKIEFSEKFDVELAKNINNNLYTSFEKDFIKFKINKPVTFYNELIPVYFNQDRSLPRTKEIISFVGDYVIEITNKDKLKGKLYKDEKDRLYQFF